MYIQYYFCINYKAKQQDIMEVFKKVKDSFGVNILINAKKLNIWDNFLVIQDSI